MEQAREAATTSIQAIDELIVILDKLLQIAEAESTTRRRLFRPVTLREIITDVVELYDATAEANGVTLAVDVAGEPATLGTESSSQARRPILWTTRSSTAGARRRRSELRPEKTGTRCRSWFRTRGLGSPSRGDRGWARIILPRAAASSRPHSLILDH